MHIFEITIQRHDDDGWPVIVEQGTPDRLTPQRNEARLRLDTAHLLSLDLDPLAYGRALGEALFQGDVYDAFCRALSRSDDRLRVLLFIEATDLLGLRWERLCAPIDDSWQLLALSQRAPFSRYLPSLTDRRFPPIGRQDLRALIIAASPPAGNRFGLEPFDVQAATDGVSAALGSIPSALLADGVTALGRPTLNEICTRISAEPYSILHLVCHGRVLPDGDSAIFLAGADDPSSIDPITATRFIERLSMIQGARGLPHLIFLSTCESASPDADAALGGLAQRLVRELGAPAVVAMTDTVEVVTANALAAAFYSRLVDHGEVDRALVEATAGLAERGDVTVPVLFSRLGGQPMFRDTPDRPLTHGEVNAGLARLQPLVAERAPVLVDELDRAALVVRRSLGTDSELLSSEARRDRSDALEAIDALCLESVELDFRALALGQAPPAYDDRCPFPGLRAFASDLRAFFFGREALVARLLERLGEHSFLAVMGASGSGKSSVVFAGLAPALQARRPERQVLTMTPGAQPLATLEATLAKSSGPALLIVDQFEEAFTLCTDLDARRTFFQRLLALLSDHLVVLTMRADFWGEVAPYAELRQLMQAHQELVAPMSPEELRRAMELQAAQVGLRFEADLGGQILDDVRGEPGAMPLLQHALQELWQRRRGRWLRATEYRAIGGIQQAIAHTADTIYNSSTPAERERLRDIFVRLTRIDRANAGGEERRDSRQRVAFTELVPAGADPAPVRDLVRRLADARLVVTGVAAGTETVEVAHEALIRSWPRLRTWLEEDRQGLLLRDALRQAAQEWAGEEHDEDLLFRGSRLDEALALAQLPRFAANAQERAFLDAAQVLRAREEAERDAQRQRELEQARALAAEQQRRADESAAAARQLRQRAVFLAGVAAVALLAMVAAGLFGVRSQQAETRAEVSADEARTSAAVARTNAAEARTRALAANARAALGFGQADLGLGLALAAARSEPPLAESYSVLATAAENAARRRFNGAAPIRSVFFSPDGQTVGIADATQVELWFGSEYASGQPMNLGQLKNAKNFGYAGGANIAKALLSPDGTTVFVEHSGFASLLFGVAGGYVIEGDFGFGSFTEAAFHPDSRQLVLGFDDGSLAIVDVADHRVARTVAAPGATAGAGEPGAVVNNPSPAEAAIGSGMVGLAVSPDGSTIATLDGSGHIRLIDFIDGTERATLDEPEGSPTSQPFYGLAFRPDGAQLAAAGPDGTVYLWQVDDPGAPKTLTGSTAVSSLAFSADGAMLAVGHVDGLIVLWDLAARQALRRYAGHSDAITSLAFRPDGMALISGSADNSARLWDTNSGFLSARFPASAASESVTQLAFASDGTPLVAHLDGQLQRWEPEYGQTSPALEAGSVLDVERNGGRALAYDQQRGELQLWDLVTNARLSGFATAPLGQALFIPGAEQVLLRQSDGQLQLLSLADGALAPALGLPSSAGPVILAADGSRAASIESKMQATGINVMIDSSLNVWRPTSGEQALRIQISTTTTPTSLAISADGAWVAIGMYDETVQIRSAADGALLHTLLGHTGPVSSAAFSPDGMLLVTGSSDQSLRFWDPANGAELRTIALDRAEPVMMIFNPAGDQLLVGASDGSATLWRVDNGQALVDWVVGNRAVAELSCEERARYQLGEPCSAEPVPTSLSSPDSVISPTQMTAP